MQSRALIVFVKQPESGQVKTRLCPPLTPEEAAALYTCFLKDAFIQYARLASRANFKIHIFATPAGSKSFFKKFIGDVADLRPLKIEIIEQQGADLGERMEHAFRTLFEKFSDTVIIGSDHPTLPDRYLENAFEQLLSYDAVIGPSADGGYYLLGLKKVYHEIFSGIAWSGPNVFSETMKTLNRRRVAQLPEWYDIDDEASLKRMVREFRERRLESIPRHTMVFLKNNLTRFSG